MSTPRERCHLEARPRALSLAHPLACRNWLKSRFHFSFAEYKGSKNDNFGCLRVMNDDLVQPTFLKIFQPTRFPFIIEGVGQRAADPGSIFTVYLDPRADRC